MQTGVNMRLKYYLRGLGIGIFVTALVLGISTNRSIEMTDAQIIERAKELGMQEKNGNNRLLSDDKEEKAQIVEQDTVQTEEVQTEKTQTEEVQTEEVQTEEVQVEEVQVEETQAEEIQTESDMKENQVTEPNTEDILENLPTEEEEKTEDEAVEQMVVITIQGGDTSVGVSKRVAEAGLVESATAYDRFLCKNGYDKKLAVGVHEIPMGASEEEIAKILTTRKK